MWISRLSGDLEIQVCLAILIQWRCCCLLLFLLPRCELPLTQQPLPSGAAQTNSEPNGFEFQLSRALRQLTPVQRLFAPACKPPGDRPPHLSNPPQPGWGPGYRRGPPPAPAAPVIRQRAGVPVGAAQSKPFSMRTDRPSPQLVEDG